MTAAMVFALAVYAFTTKNDLEILIGLIFILSATLLVFGIMVIFVRAYWVHMVYCGLCVIIFGIYMIFDIKILMGGETYDIFIDDYVLAALIIYLDIIVIFLYILKMLGSSNNR